MNWMPQQGEKSHLTLDVYYIDRTDKSIQISYTYPGAKRMWLPLSLIVNLTEPDHQGISKVTAPEWWFLEQWHERGIPFETTIVFVHDFVCRAGSIASFDGLTLRNEKGIEIARLVPANRSGNAQKPGPQSPRWEDRRLAEAMEYYDRPPSILRQRPTNRATPRPTTKRRKAPNGVPNEREVFEAVVIGWRDGNSQPPSWYRIKLERNWLDKEIAPFVQNRAYGLLHPNSSRPALLQVVGKAGPGCTYFPTEYGLELAEKWGLI